MLAGGTHVIKDLPNPAPEWISVRSWLEITTTQVLDKFTNFSEEFKNHLDGFKRIFDSMTPHRYVFSSFDIFTFYSSRMLNQIDVWFV